MRITLQLSVLPESAEEFYIIQKEYKKKGMPISVLFDDMMTALKIKRESDEIK